MRFVVSGGGTGGHIYPALAIATGLTQRYPDAEVLYIGTEKGMEAEIVPKEGWTFKGIPASGLQRKLALGNLRALWQGWLGYRQAGRIIRRWRPQAVIGTGGYVSGPVVLAAALSRIPTLIHEQNAYPGVTNRLLSRVAHCVAVTFAGSERYFPGKAKIRLTGLPVRPEFLASERMGVDPDRQGSEAEMTILSFGGSRGAKVINEAMLEVIKAYGNRPHINLVHITGAQGYQEFREKAVAEGINLNQMGNITVHPYLYNINEILAKADLVVSRAGAATLAELTALGIPSILIPYPLATENHQEFNARALEKEGAAVVIPDKELTGAYLYRRINRLIEDREKLERMGNASKNMGKIDALEEIIKCIDEII